MGLFTRSQPDPIAPAPCQPQIRSHVVAFPASRQDVRDLSDCLDDVEAVRRLVQRSSAANIARVLRLVAAQEGQAI